MANLILPLKVEDFDAIRDGSKTEAYRRIDDYWYWRLVDRAYDRVIFTRGHPSVSDTSSRLVRAWRGYDLKHITHKHFGPHPVTVFAIRVGEPI